MNPSLVTRKITGFKPARGGEVMSDKMGFLYSIRNERGITIILIAVLMVVFLGFAAFAIDIGHVVVARNEVHNAADAGALAGARFLYSDDGTEVNAGANLIAYNAAVANKSEKVPVEAQWSGGNEGDVQRGHWSFATRTFTPNSSLVPIDLWDYTTEELDANPDFINAVRVKTRRESTPVASFFANVFGINQFVVSKEAVAYIGFAGTLAPDEVKQPIAVCQQALLATGEYTCSVGRMINSGNIVNNSETGGWTDFNQDSPCLGGTNAQAVKSSVCGSGNPGPLELGKPVASNGGDIQSAFNDLINCWTTYTGKTKPWTLALPVIDCPDNNIGTCQNVEGAVTVNIVWITGPGDDPQYDNSPREMAGIRDSVYTDWSSSDTNGRNRWLSFVDHFHLKNVDGTPAAYDKKSIYFLPDCKPHPPIGRSGGRNFGIRAKIPVLVE